MKKVLILMLAFGFMGLAPRQAEARRHKKFKGIIIVNQILHLRGSIRNNGVEVPEFSGVKQGDVLETGDKSDAVIRIPGLAIFKMGANTQFKLTKFSDRTVTKFELVKGNVLAVYHRPGDHEFVLNHSTIKLHGTTFFATSDKDQPKDKVCLCDGKIQLLAPGASAADLNANAPAASAVASASPSETDTSKKSKKHKKKHGGSAEEVAAASPSPSSATDAAANTAPNASPSAQGSPAANLVLAQSPSAAPTQAPTPTPLPRVIELKSSHEHKQCEISDGGIEEKKLNLLDLHSDAEIQDLESMYALP